MLRWCVGFILASLLIPCTASHAQFLTIFGGPQYTPPNGGLFGGGFSAVVNDSGTAFASVEDRTDFSGSPFRVPWHAVRWDSFSSPVLLNEIGIDPDQFTRHSVVGVNAAGTAVGRISVYGTSDEIISHVVRWNSSTNAVEVLNGVGAPSGINASGTVAGSLFQYDTGPGGNPFLHWGRAARWDAGGTTATELDHFLAHPTGAFQSAANGINAAGTIVGFSEKYDGVGNFLGFIPARWDAGGTAITELTHPGAGVSTEGYNYATANAINSAGMIVGQVDAFTLTHDDLGIRAVRWNPGQTSGTILEALGIAADGTSRAFAQMINDQGMALGVAEKYDALGVSRGDRAVIWKAGDITPIELAVLDTDLDGNGLSGGNGINNLGIVVGTSMVYGDMDSALHAVYWTPDGSVVDLNTLIDPDSGWFLESALSVSDTGWIVGIGQFDPDGPGEIIAHSRSFLIQIPEPGTMALAGVATAMLFKRRSRNH